MENLILPQGVSVIEATTQDTSLSVSAQTATQTKTNRNKMPTLAEVEKAYILKVYEETEGDKKEMAEVLGVSVKTVYNKLAKYGRK